MCYVGLHRTIAGVLLLLNLGCHRTQPEVVSLLSMTNAWLDAKGEQAFIKESAKRAASKMDAFRCQKLTEILCHPYSRGDIWAVIEFERFYHSNSYILYVLTETACFEYRFAKNWRVINRLKIGDRSEERLIMQRECTALNNFKHLAWHTRDHVAYDRPLICVFVTLYKEQKPADMFFSFIQRIGKVSVLKFTRPGTHRRIIHCLNVLSMHRASRCSSKKQENPIPGSRGHR